MKSIVARLANMEGDGSAYWKTKQIVFSKLYRYVSKWYEYKERFEINFNNPRFFKFFRIVYTCENLYNIETWFDKFIDTDTSCELKNYENVKKYVYEEVNFEIYNRHDDIPGEQIEFANHNEWILNGYMSSCMYMSSMPIKYRSCLNNGHSEQFFEYKESKQYVCTEFIDMNDYKNQDNNKHIVEMILQYIKELNRHLALVIDTEALCSGEVFSNKGATDVNILIRRHFSIYIKLGVPIFECKKKFECFHPGQTTDRRTLLPFVVKFMSE